MKKSLLFIFHNSYFIIFMDTQWPRWEVFKKDSARKAYQAVGSIHAVDGEHALLNARNVFVRRPSAVSLWVVRADDIFSLTREEMDADAGWMDGDDGGETAVFHICAKISHRRSMTFMDYAGEIEATSPQQALQLGLTQFELEDALAWWVFVETAVVSTEDDVVDAWFAPAKTKTYKQQSQYGFVSKLRKGRQTDN